MRMWFRDRFRHFRKHARSWSRFRVEGCLTYLAPPAILTGGRNSENSTNWPPTQLPSPATHLYPVAPPYKASAGPVPKGFSSAVSLYPMQGGIGSSPSFWKRTSFHCGSRCQECHHTVRRTWPSVNAENLGRPAKGSETPGNVVDYGLAAFKCCTRSPAARAYWSLPSHQFSLGMETRSVSEGKDYDRVRSLQRASAHLPEA